MRRSTSTAHSRGTSTSCGTIRLVLVSIHRLETLGSLPNYSMLLTVLRWLHRLLLWPNVAGILEQSTSEYSERNCITLSLRISKIENSNKKSFCLLRTAAVELVSLSGKKVCFREALLPLLARQRLGLYYNMPVVRCCFLKSTRHLANFLKVDT